MVTARAVVAEGRATLRGCGCARTGQVAEAWAGYGFALEEARTRLEARAVADRARPRGDARPLERARELASSATRRRAVARRRSMRSSARAARRAGLAALRISCARDRPVRLASRARADRVPRPGTLARRPRGARARGVGRQPRLPVRRGDAPARRGRRVRRDAGRVLRRRRTSPPAPPRRRRVGRAARASSASGSRRTCSTRSTRARSATSPRRRSPIVDRRRGARQWMHQGVDVWAAGPVGRARRGGGDAWLRDLVGFDQGAWGVLTSGGVMANIMALTVARDVHLASSCSAGRAAARRGSSRACASTSATRRTSRSRAASTSSGSRRRRSRVLPSDERFRLHGEPVADAIAEDRAGGLVPFAIAPVAGSTNTGSVDLVGELADVAERERAVVARRRRVRRSGAASRRATRVASRTSSARTA